MPNPPLSRLKKIDLREAWATEADVLYELLLKLGLDLCIPIEEPTIADTAVHSVGALALGMAAWREEQNPADETTDVFRDSAFADDVARTNCGAIFQQYGLANVRSW